MPVPPKFPIRRRPLPPTEPEGEETVAHEQGETPAFEKTEDVKPKGKKASPLADAMRRRKR
jgi:hypothetical protein